MTFSFKSIQELDRHQSAMNPSQSSRVPDLSIQPSQAKPSQAKLEKSWLNPVNPIESKMGSSESNYLDPKKQKAIQAIQSNPIQNWKNPDNEHKSAHVTIRLNRVKQMSNCCQLCGPPPPLPPPFRPLLLLLRNILPKFLAVLPIFPMWATGKGQLFTTFQLVFDRCLFIATTFFYPPTFLVAFLVAFLVVFLVGVLAHSVILLLQITITSLASLKTSLSLCSIPASNLSSASTTY